MLNRLEVRQIRCCTFLKVVLANWNNGTASIKNSPWTKGCMTVWPIALIQGLVPYHVPGLSLFITIIFRTLVRLWTYLRTETALPQFLFMYVDSIRMSYLLYLIIASSALVIIDHDQHKKWINKLSVKQRENNFARERSSQIRTQLKQLRKQSLGFHKLTSS